MGKAHRAKSHLLDSMPQCTIRALCLTHSLSFSLALSTERYLYFIVLYDIVLQVIQLRGRLGGILNILTGMFGGGTNIVEKADQAVEKLQGYKERMVSRYYLYGVYVIQYSCCS